MNALEKKLEAQKNNKNSNKSKKKSKEQKFTNSKNGVERNLFIFKNIQN
jgi:hypothetical protein